MMANSPSLSASDLTAIASTPSSPRSSALPSPPDSPSAASVFSVSSSFFFSSSAPSPHSGSASGRLSVAADHRDRESREHDSTQGLIIPALVLPAALRRPTLWGQTLGEVRLLILGSRDAEKASLCSILLEDNDDVVETDGWEGGAEDGVKAMGASTDWIEHRDPHGLEKFEPARNVEVLEMPGYDHTDNHQDIIKPIMVLIEQPFHALSDVLDPTRDQSPLTASLLASSSSPLFTALIFLLPSNPSALELALLDPRSRLVPLILLPQAGASLSHALARLPPHIARSLTPFCPRTPSALRTGLFRSPDTLAALRTDAADKFLAWREVERAVRGVRAGRDRRGARGAGWSKAQWEVEWRLSQDVAARLCGAAPSPPRCGGAGYDPLHLPSLLLCALGVFGSLARWLLRALGPKRGAGGFCVGLGVGLSVGVALLRG